MEIVFERCPDVSEQLKDCLRVLSRQQQRLEQLCMTISKDAQMEEFHGLLPSLQEQGELLQYQIRAVCDMQKAWERIERVYCDCENRILEMDEADRRIFEETMDVVNLGAWKKVRVLLQQEE